MSKNSIEIGKIVSVDGVNVTIELFEDLASSQYLTHSSKIYEVGGVGNYLKSKKIDGELIFEILSEQASEYEVKLDKEMLPKPNIFRIIKAKIKGKLFSDGNYRMGIYDSPMVFDSIYLTEKDDVEKLFVPGNKQNKYEIGKVVLNDDIPFLIDINKFFASHIAILGNTGSGKSNTLASLYENMLNMKSGNEKKFAELMKNKSNLLVIDTNGEYTSSFIDNEFKRLIRINLRESESEFQIPLMCTNSEDWGVMLNATDKTQQPLLDRTFADLNKISDVNQLIDIIENKTKQLMKIIINSNKSNIQKINAIKSLKTLITEYLIKYNDDSIVSNYLNNFFDFSINYTDLFVSGKKLTSEQMEEHINSFAISTLVSLTRDVQVGIDELEFFLNLNYQYNVNAFEINENYIGPLLSRFNSMKNNFKKIFSSSNEKNDFVKTIFEDKIIAILDISLVNSKFKVALSSLIANKLYKCYEEKEVRKKQTLSIIIDEAHNYLNSKTIENEDKMALRTLEVFEKIIKEGRKFGVYMTISSQRPADISPTILSQCHNYVIHRLANPNDIKQINNVVSFVDQKSIDMLPILAPGQAIFSGTAFLNPTLVQVNKPINAVDSSTPILTDIWLSEN